MTAAATSRTRWYRGTVYGTWALLTKTDRDGWIDAGSVERTSGASAAYVGRVRTPGGWREVCSMATLAGAKGIVEGAVAAKGGAR